MIIGARVYHIRTKQLVTVLEIYPNNTIKVQAKGGAVDIVKRSDVRYPSAGDAGKVSAEWSLAGLALALALTVVGVGVWQWRDATRVTHVPQPLPMTAAATAYVKSADPMPYYVRPDFYTLPDCGIFHAGDEPAPCVDREPFGVYVIVDHVHVPWRVDVIDTWQGDGDVWASGTWYGVACPADTTCPRIDS